jgi:hypothetical protein
MMQEISADYEQARRRGEVWLSALFHGKPQASAGGDGFSK